MTATVAALLARQDVSTASFTATIAVDNNFLVLAAAGLVAADVACAAYNIYNAFEQGGFDEGCKQLGIEVVCYGAGLTVDKTPGLKVALGSCANELIILGEKYNKTTLAKGIARAEGTILKTQAKVFGGIGKARDKVVDKAVQAKDKMLQQFSSSSHAQPGSILVPQKPGVQVLLSAQEIAELERVLGQKALPASSRMNKVRLHNQLVAEEIANGHAFEKHVINQNEFPGWTRQQYQQHIENILNDQPVKLYQKTCMHETLNINSVTGKATKEIKSITYYVDDIEKPTTWLKTSGEKKIIYKESSNTLVVYNPNEIDGGTAYQPREKLNKFFDSN